MFLIDVHCIGTTLKVGCRKENVEMTEEQKRLVDQQIMESIALSAKLQAETAKLQREFNWYPVIVSASLVAATATLIKVFT